MHDQLSTKKIMQKYPANSGKSQEKWYQPTKMTKIDVVKIKNHLKILKEYALGFLLAQNPVFYVIPRPLFLKFCFGSPLLLLQKVPIFFAFLTVDIESPLHITPPYTRKNDPAGLQQSFSVRRDPTSAFLGNRISEK